MPKSILLPLLLLIGVVGASSCNPFSPQVCTLIGCDSGLAVELEGTPDVPYRIHATAEGTETQTIACPDEGACRLFFEGFTPDQVTITYEAEGRTVERTFSPEYVRSRPNGEDCPPECVNATVVLVLTG